MGTSPRLLAGPLLRRAGAGVIYVWLATDGPCRVRGTVVGLESARRGPRLGSGEAESARLGRALHVHLLALRPDDDSFPAGEVLGYDLELVTDGGAVGLEDLGLLSGRGRITYDALPLPTVVIQRPGAELNVVHGSCRLLHGKGEDALEVVDEVVGRHSMDARARPTALFLTGDQIYADDVAGPMIVHVRSLAGRLIGEEDATSVPGVPHLDEVPAYGRKGIACDEARFTSGHADNHLATFGEFAAMYLMAYNEAIWPDRFPPAGRVVPGRGPRALGLRRKYATELADLERARRALPAARRALANVPTYMIFDDHDVTDDWNLTAAWRRRVHDAPAGRRIIANALAAFWAFQGWGNDPDQYDEELKSAIVDRLSGDESGDEFDRRMWGFDRWSFRAPADPPIIVMDTRTQRDYDAGEGAAHLVGDAGRQRLLELAREAGHVGGAPLIMVSAVPVCGLELQERRQKYLVKKLGPYEIDFEAWHSSLEGLVAFMRFLIEDLKLGSCIFLSGDVHYGMNLHFTFAIGDDEVRITQLVSSGQKHSGTLSRSGLQLLGRLVRARHERVGWRSPPDVPSLGAAKHRFLARSVNTDEWTEDSPVFLSPGLAGRLGIEKPPDFREARSYVKPPGDRSMLVGENNVGVVQLQGNRVVHRISSRGTRGTVVHEAALDVFQEDLQKAAQARDRR